MSRISEAIKYLLTQFVKHNPYDGIYSRNLKRHINKGERSRAIWEHHLYWNFGKRISTAICKLLNKITWNDMDDQLPHGSFVVVANHEKAIDPLYIGTTMWWKVAWLSKKKNFMTPFMKTIIGQMGAISLDEDKDGEPIMSQHTMDEIDRSIRRGHAIGVFPEGHRSKDGILKPFKTGAARLCLDYGIPYVPVAITGSRKPFKGSCHVNIGKPVYLRDDLECTYSNAKAIAVDMRNQVQSLMNGDEQPPSQFEIQPETRKVTPRYSYVFYEPSCTKSM